MKTKLGATEGFIDLYRGLSSLYAHCYLFVKQYIMLKEVLNDLYLRLLRLYCLFVLKTFRQISDNIFFFVHSRLFADRRFTLVNGLCTLLHNGTYFAGREIGAQQAAQLYFFLIQYIAVFYF